MPMTRRERQAVSQLLVTVGGSTHCTARRASERATRICAPFAAVLPFSTRRVQARCSGESAWFPPGDFRFDVGVEHATSTPAPGQILLYPKGVSETETLFPS